MARKTKMKTAAPLTKDDVRDIVRDELKAYPTRLELDERLATMAATMATKQDLSVTVQLLLTSIDARFEAFRRLQQEDMARCVNAANEEMRTWMRAQDDQYRDLPRRVTTLEESVADLRKRR